MAFLQAQYEHIHQQLSDCDIVVVTKMQDVPTTQQAIDAGVMHIAEAKVQDAMEKKPQLTGSFRYHLIGHLQSNKAKEAVQLFDMIQSVDSLKLIDALQQHAQDQEKIIPILLQINTTHEKQKYGFSLQDIHHALLYAQKQPHLDVQGCMGMGKQDAPDITRMGFRWLRHICDTHDLPICSMGMSHDWQLAYEEGSTMVRIGSAFFI